MDFRQGKLDFRRGKSQYFPRDSLVSGNFGDLFSYAICYHVCARIYFVELVDSQESLTGEDRPELSGTTKEVTKRNNTDHILDRLINWQYLLPPRKLFYTAGIQALSPEITNWGKNDYDDNKSTKRKFFNKK